MPLIPTFDSPDAAVIFAEILRWPNGTACPSCGGVDKIYTVAWRKYRCGPCKYFFNVRTNTVLHGVKIGMPALYDVINVAASDAPIFEAAVHAGGLSAPGTRQILERLKAAQPTDPYDAVGVLQAALDSRMTISWGRVKHFGLDPNWPVGLKRRG